MLVLWRIADLIYVRFCESYITIFSGSSATFMKIKFCGVLELFLFFQFRTPLYFKQTHITFKHAYDSQKIKIATLFTPLPFRAINSRRLRSDINHPVNGSSIPNPPSVQI